ncbi:ABC-2 type transporter [Paenibacillus curdlanolyticus YK9]|uniref:Transport permease protein n=1 Tax=Paenibacillus curdlanolyticus YK9 TaxID=717606 RepID=E0IEQ5_9BACL|nr:ABC transporter permease [Paenibacillus curdlanolyticus]EFM09143.1 ABC-2 type transporter [Paenibacillus curdlanolyticus YK9]
MLIPALKSFWKYRDLITQFVRRDVVGRYKGSFLGLFWTFLNPLLMLTVYTFVFSSLFKARWGTGGENKVEYALVLFAGLVVFNIFSEVIVRSPGLILSNTNYVTKVVFPLEILPVAVLGSSLIHAAISMSILLVGLMLFLGVLQWTLFLLPIVMIPLILMALGLGWILASLGVFLRDLSQIIAISVQALMLLSPIFYSISSIPSNIKFIYYINPMSYVIEDTRRVVIWGQMPQWTWLGIGTVIGVFICAIGYAWFQKSKSAFADVL